MKTDIFGRYSKACLTLLMTMMLIKSAESYKCYNCFFVLGLGANNCLVINNQTEVKDCTEGCQSIVSKLDKTVSRDCGTLNTGCLGKGDMSVCTISCKKDYCNTTQSSSRFQPTVALLLSMAALTVWRHFV